MVTEFMRKRKTTDHSVILNDIDISYGTLTKTLSGLHNYRSESSKTKKLQKVRRGEWYYCSCN